MNGRFFTRTRLALMTLLILPWLLLLFLRSVLSPSLSCVLGAIAIICTFTALAFLFTAPVQGRPALLPTRAKDTPPQPQAPSQKRLSIPGTLAEVYQQFNPTEFEIFSAAVVVALGEGHQFVAHSGKRGDRGVDFRLQNIHGLRVVGQCKFYAPHRRVRPTEIRDFGGAIGIHDAVYGYFVTTSTLTSGAKNEKESHGRIRLIEGPYLESLLRTRSHEIAQAYDDIRQQIKRQMQY